MEVLQITNGILLSGKKKNKSVGKIQTDTRELKKGDVFLAIIGKQLDGHDYIKEAIKKKASCVIVSKNMQVKTKIPIIKVSNTLDAYFALAYRHHQMFPVPVISVTGSIGKTTTKELIASMLSQKYSVLKSKGNFNNHIGIPKTMLELNETHDIMVLEMGMNHAQEITKLSLLAHPNTAVITNIGTSHIGYLKSRKNIWKAKMEIVDGMESGNLYVNGNDDYLKKVKDKKNFHVIKITTKKNKVKILKDTEDEFEFIYMHQKEKYDIHIPAPVSYLLSNILLAIEVCIEYGVSMEDIVMVLEHYPFSLKGRMELIPFGEHQMLINDSYNASYESTLAGLHYLQKRSGTKCFILGSILELGEMSKKIHTSLVSHFKKEKNMSFIFIGDETYCIHQKIKKSLYFPDVEEFLEYIRVHPLKEDSIYIKGSRMVHLDKIVSYMTQKK